MFGDLDTHLEISKNLLTNCCRKWLLVLNKRALIYLLCHSFPASWSEYCRTRLYQSQFSIYFSTSCFTMSLLRWFLGLVSISLVFFSPQQHGKSDDTTAPLNIADLAKDKLGTVSPVSKLWNYIHLVLFCSNNCEIKYNFTYLRATFNGFEAMTCLTIGQTLNIKVAC